MNIEIVEFYPKKDDPKEKILEGTLHVYLPDLHFDLRGIYVKLVKNHWWFMPPSYVEFDKEEGKNVRFPAFSFTDREKNREMIKQIHKKGKKYIIENYILKRKCKK